MHVVASRSFYVIFSEQAALRVGGLPHFLLCYLFPVQQIINNGISTLYTFVIFCFGLATNTLNVRNKNNKNITIIIVVLVL